MSYPLMSEDVEKLYDAAKKESGQSVACENVLRHVHTYQGEINVANLMGLDSNLREAALRLILMLARGESPANGILLKEQFLRLRPEESGPEM